MSSSSRTSSYETNGVVHIGKVPHSWMELALMAASTRVRGGSSDYRPGAAPVQVGALLVGDVAEMPHQQ